MAKRLIPIVWAEEMTAANVDALRREFEKALDTTGHVVFTNTPVHVTYVEVDAGNEEPTPSLGWSVVHNVVAHPLLILADLANKVHDWTAKKAYGNHK